MNCYDTSEEIKLRLKALKKRINLMTEMKQIQLALDKLPSFAEPVPEVVSRLGMKPVLFGSYGLGFLS